MEIVKSQWSTDNNRMQLMMPLSKVDEENRIVSGYASLDNADSQGDVITKEANASAFGRFRGNVREMHQPIAAGRMVNFREDDFYDPDTKKFYSGIWVDVYVSKGAQDTWEKVLDGTLQGFSIGGEIIDSSSEFVKDAASDMGRMVRFVKDYNLVELSLVDSPANKLANVFSITKSAGGDTVVTGMIVDTQSENVFWCTTDKVAKTTSDESVLCHEGHKMENIGWIEYDNADSKTQKVAGVVDNYLRKQEESPANNEGGVSEMADVDVVEEVKTDDAPVEAEAPVGGGAEQTEVKDQAQVEEVQETDLSEKFDSLKSHLDEGLEKSKAEVQEVFAKFNSDFDELKKGIETRFSELGEKHAELSEKFAGLKDSLDKVEKSVGTLEGETAIKKSGDLGGSAEEDKTLTKSTGLWAGSLFGN